MAFGFRRLSVRASASADPRRIPTAAAPVTQQRPVRHTVDRIRMHFLPQLLDYQTQINQLEKKMGELGEVLNDQMAHMSTVLDTHHPVPRRNPTQTLMGATRRSPFASKLLLLPQDTDLDDISLEMRATDAMWSEAEAQHRAAIAAAQEALTSSQQRAPMYENYRRQLLDLAQEAEAEEAAARRRRRAAMAAERQQMRREAEARKAARAKARAQPPAPDFVQPAAPTTTKVNIAVKCHTHPGQDVLLVGSCPELGSWDCGRAVPMVWTEGHVWRATLELDQPPEKLEFKAVLRQGDGIVWERGDNHVAELVANQDLDSFHVFAA